MKIFAFIILTLNLTLFSQEVQMDSKENNMLIGTIGTLASSNIYLSYLSIDLISEQVIQKKLPKTKSSKLILSLRQINEQLNRSLEELYQVSKSDLDAKLITRLVGINKKMKKDSDLLERYIKNPTKKNLQKFRETHKVVYQSLQLFYGIN